MAKISENHKKAISECRTVIQYTPDTKQRLALYGQLYGLIRAAITILEKYSTYEKQLNEVRLNINLAWGDMGDPRRWPAAEQRMVITAATLDEIGFTENIIAITSEKLNLSNWMRSPEKEDEYDG
jgi:hypothetical protein